MVLNYNSLLRLSNATRIYRYLTEKISEHVNANELLSTTVSLKGKNELMPIGRNYSVISNLKS